MSLQVPSKGEHDWLTQWVSSLDTRVTSLEQMVDAYEPEPPAVKHAVPLELYDVLEAAIAWRRVYQGGTDSHGREGYAKENNCGSAERLRLSEAVLLAQQAGLL